MKKRATKNTRMDGYVIPVFGGDPQRILDQEAEGQESFVTSTTLPTRIMTDDGKKILESFGVVFGDEVEDDPMFQYVTLPEGWKREGTGHSMHSDVLDDKGRKRIGVFYKAAFYDRSANMHVNRRYSYTYDYERSEAEDVHVGVAKDGEEVIYETDPLPGKKANGEEDYDSYRNCQALAKAWLDEHYPEWNDPAAYWDE